MTDLGRGYYRQRVLIYPWHPYFRGIKMNKKIMIATAAAIVILAGATFAYFTVLPTGQSDTESDIESDADIISVVPSAPPSEAISSGDSKIEPDVTEPDADKVIASFGSVGKPYTLHSRYFKQGDIITEETPDLGWDGDMILTINTTKISDYETDIDKLEIWERAASRFSSPCILTISATLENIDAEQSFGVKYEFNASMFRLGAYQDLLSENINNAEYVSLGQVYGVYEPYFDKHGEGDRYYYFTLEQGESLDFTLKFLIDRSFLQYKAPFLTISAGRAVTTGICLSDIIEE